MMVPLTKIRNTGKIHICGKGAELLLRLVESQVLVNDV